MDDLPSGDHVRIHISRIGRLHHERAAFPVKEVQDVAKLVAGAARYKDFVIRNTDAAAAIMCRDRRPKKRRAAFRHVTVETRRVRLVIDAFVQGMDDRIA